MSNEELNEATSIIIKALSESSLNGYAKIELMINLKKFLEDYDKNIQVLRVEDKKKKYERPFKRN